MDQPESPAAQAMDLLGAWAASKPNGRRGSGKNFFPIYSQEIQHMIVTTCQQEKFRRVSASRKEFDQLWRSSSAPFEFLNMLHECKVPLKAIRVMLPAIDELDLSAAHHPPLKARKVSRRFMSHLEFAIAASIHHEHEGGPSTRRIASELGKLLPEMEARGLSQTDRQLVAELAQVAASLHAIAKV